MIQKWWPDRRRMFNGFYEIEFNRNQMNEIIEFELEISDFYFSPSPPLFLLLLQKSYFRLCDRMWTCDSKTFTIRHLDFILYIWIGELLRGCAEFTCESCKNEKTKTKIYTKRVRLCCLDMENENTIKNADRTLCELWLLAADNLCILCMCVGCSVLVYKRRDERPKYFSQTSPKTFTVIF